MGSLADFISGLTTIFEDLTGKTAATKAREVATEIWNEITTGSKLSDADGDTYIELEESADDDHARIYTAGTEIVTVDDSGNVGIGTNSPQSILHVQESAVSGASYISTARIISEVTGGNNYIQLVSDNDVLTGLIMSDSDDSNVAMVYYDHANDKMYLRVNDASAMIIDSSGNVGIGKSPGYQLELSTDSAGKPSTNTWTIVSDERVKKNIESFNDGLEVLLSLEPIQYEYNGKAGYNIEGVQIGFNATQEIKKNKANYLFGKYKAKLDEDDEEETELLNYNGHALSFILRNSVIELKNIIDEQQIIIEEQQLQIDDLIKRIEVLEKK